MPCVITEFNDDLVATPHLANQDPYQKGWFIILKPADWSAVKGSLTPGAPVYNADATIPGTAPEAGGNDSDRLPCLSMSTSKTLKPASRAA